MPTLATWLAGLPQQVVFAPLLADDASKAGKFLMFTIGFEHYTILHLVQTLCVLYILHLRFYMMTRSFFAGQLVAGGSWQEAPDS